MLNSHESTKLLKPKELVHKVRDIIKAQEVKRILPPIGPEVRSAWSETEFLAIYEIEVAEYGAAEIARREDALSWFQRCRVGAYLLFKDCKIIGGCGLWPIEADIYKQIREGELVEQDIKGEHIIECASKEPLAHWYAGDVIIQEKERNPILLKILLVRTISDWLARDDLPEELNICAFIYSRKGRDMAEKFGFMPVAESPDGHPVYVLEGPKAGLKDRVQKRFGTPKHDQKSIEVTHQALVSAEPTERSTALVSPSPIISSIQLSLRDRPHYVGITMVMCCIVVLVVRMIVDPSNFLNWSTALISLIGTLAAIISSLKRS